MDTRPGPLFMKKCRRRALVTVLFVDPAQLRKKTDKQTRRKTRKETRPKQRVMQVLPPLPWPIVHHLFPPPPPHPCFHTDDPRDALRHCTSQTLKHCPLRLTQYTHHRRASRWYSIPLDGRDHRCSFVWVNAPDSLLGISMSTEWWFGHLNLVWSVKREPRKGGRYWIEKWLLIWFHVLKVSWNDSVTLGATGGASVRNQRGQCCR